MASLFDYLIIKIKIMNSHKFSYKVFFDKVFDPIALYKLRENYSRPVTSSDIIFFDVNPAYERVMKLKRDNIIGKSFMDVWPMAEPRWGDIVVQCFNELKSVRCEGESRDIDSWLEAVAFPVSQDMAAAIFIDRTEWKKSEDELKRSQQDLRELATKLTLSEENTRRDIAQDLHDHLGYELVSQLMTLRTLSEKNLPDDISVMISDLIKNTEKLIASNRNLVFELSPPVLREVGLNPALEALAKNMLEPRGIEYEFIFNGSADEIQIDDDICVLLYRMTRELLFNVIKHAHATKVNIIVNRGVNKSMVAVEDNGCGFDADKVTFGLGLFSIRERLLTVGGEMKIVSAPASGTMIIMTCPSQLVD